MRLPVTGGGVSLVGLGPVAWSLALLCRGPKTPVKVTMHSCWRRHGSMWARRHVPLNTHQGVVGSVALKKAFGVMGALKKAFGVVVGPQRSQWHWWKPGIGQPIRRGHEGLFFLDGRPYELLLANPCDENL